MGYRIGSIFYQFDMIYDIWVSLNTGAVPKDGNF